MKNLSDIVPDFTVIKIGEKDVRFESITIKEIGELQKQIQKKKRSEYIEICKEIGQPITFDDVQAYMSKEEEEEIKLSDPSILVDIFMCIIKRCNPKDVADYVNIDNLFATLNDEKIMSELLDVVMGKFIDKKEGFGSSPAKKKGKKQDGTTQFV